MKPRASFLATFSLFLALPAAHAGADVFADCQRVINSLPVTITNSGTYCLERNLSTSVATGAAITVAAHNVTVDFKGHRIDGSAAGAGTLAVGVGTNGVLVPSGLTVRNGRVKGFLTGVSVGGTRVIIEDITAESNTATGISCSGTACIVRRNQVLNTGGAVLPPPGIEAVAGIVNYSDGGTTQDNLVSGFTGPQIPHAIEVGQWGVGGIVRDNQVIGNGGGFSVGIFVAPAGLPPLHAGVLIAGNQILGFQSGIRGGTAAVSCRATQNRMANVATPITICVDAGDNN